MEWKAVESSQIAEVGHDAETDTLGIRFKGNKSNPQGSEYHYANVDKTLYDAILNADSVGKAFTAYVKAYPTKYPYKKIEPVAE